MISPPSGTSVADVWNAIKAGAPTHVRMVFGYDMADEDQAVVDDRDIDVRAGLTVTDMLNGETDLTFGKAVSKQLTTNILITERTAYLPWTSEFRLDMGVEIGGSTVWTTIGYFSGSRPNNVSTLQTVEFTAYDRMSAFDQLADEFWSGLDFTTPLSLEDIYDALCTYCGVTNVSGDELSASFSRTYSAAPMDLTGYTCRDVLAWIAEAVGCYARITSAGYCKLLWYGDVTSHVITRNEEFHVEHADLYSGMIWDEFDEYTWNEAEVFTWNEVEGYYGATYGVRGVKIKQTNLGMDVDYPSTQPWNVYTIMDNPFLQIEDLVQDPITYVKPIYDRLTALGGQLPMNADCIGCWCIEAGDIITIHVADEEIHLPVFCKTMRWNGAMRDEYETTGEKFRKIINDSQKQRVINNRNIKLYVDGNYYGVVSGIEIDEDGVYITGSKNIIMQAGDDKWTFDSNGLLYKDANQTYPFQIANFSERDSKATGIFTQYGSGQQVGMLRFVAGVHSTVYPTMDLFGYITLEMRDYGTITDSRSGISITGFGASLYPQADQTYLLGSTTKAWMVTFTQKIAALEAIYGNSNIGWIDMYPKGGDYSYIRFSQYTQNSSQYTKITGSTPANMIFEGQHNAPSSRNIKHDIEKLESKSEVIDSLEPVSFVYDNDPGEKKHFGLIYEDTVEVLPEICTENDESKAINYVELVPILLKEIQDLRKRVADLEDKLNEREG